MIVAAAIKFQDAVVSVPRPGRHRHVLKACSDLGMTMEKAAQGVYGFLNHEGAFLNRVEALLEVLACRQPMLCQTAHPLGLFSEDLW